MFNFDDQKTWEIVGNPFLIEGVGLLFLNAVITGEMKAFGIIWFQIRIRRRGAKSGNIIRVVPVEHHERIVRLRMRIKSLGYQHVRAEEYIAAPKLRQQLAADSDVPHILAIRLRRNGADL